MSKLDTTSISKKQKIVLITGISILILAAAGAGAYFGIVVPSMKQADDNSATETKPDTTYRAELKQKEDKVTKLLASGDEKSVEEANKIVETQVTTAKESGNDEYILEASLAKATFLIETQRAQEALDSVLLPLLEKYKTNDDAKFQIYGYISWAYRELDNHAKADEYFNQIPSKGWN